MEFPPADAEQGGDEVNEVDEGDMVGDMRAEYVGLLSTVSVVEISNGLDVSDGAEVMVSEAGESEGEGAISDTAENTRDPMEMAWERNSGPEIDVVISDADGSEGGGVISGCVEDVRDPVGMAWDVGSGAEVDGMAAEAGECEGEDIRDPLETPGVIDEA